MGDRMSAALVDPRAGDKAGLVSVIEEQNQRLGDDGERVLQMRLHSPVSKKGKRAQRVRQPRQLAIRSAAAV